MRVCEREGEGEREREGEGERGGERGRERNCAVIIGMRTQKTLSILYMYVVWIQVVHQWNTQEKV